MGNFGIVKQNIKLLIKSLSWKKNDNIVIFGSWFGERFADTSRFLFQYLSENKEKLGLEHVVWVTRNENILNTLRQMGYESYMIGTSESDYYHKAAGYHIVCNRPNNGNGFFGDIDGRYSFRAKRLNLWHGVMAIKGVGNATNNYKKRKHAHPFIVGLKEFLTDHSFLYRVLFHDVGGWGDCYYLSVTPAGTRDLRAFFRMPVNHYIETCSPRVKECLALTDSEIEIVEKIKKYENIILYTPTFRDESSSFDFYRAGKTIAKKLQQFNVVWIQKPHLAACKGTNDGVESNNVINLFPEFDLNIIMPYISVLITDYSTVAADAMYYHKPVFYFVPDYEEYEKKDRGFLINPKDVMVSDKIVSYSELESTLTQYFRDPGMYRFSSKYEELRLTHWGPDKSYEEIWQDIKKQMK